MPGPFVSSVSFRFCNAVSTTAEILDSNGFSKHPLNHSVSRLISLVSLVGVILAIVGGVNSSTSNNPTKIDTKTKVGVCLFVAAWLGLTIILAISAIRISAVEAGEKRLVLAVGISVPFIFVRLLYSLLGAFSKDQQFSSIKGSVTINLCMAVIEEFVVVLVLLGTGFTLRVVPKPGIAAPVPKASSYGYNSIAYEESGAAGAGHSQRNARADLGFQETLPRRGRRTGGRRGGPIMQLIGLARDRYSSR